MGELLNNKSAKAPPAGGLGVNIFGRIWALWGLITFFITFMIVFLPSMLSHLMDEPRGQRYFIAVSKIWMNAWLFLVGCPVKVRGKENFKAGASYVVVFNHNALLDVPLSSPYVPGANKTIAKASFAKIPLFGSFYSRGSILVDRKDDKSRSKSFDAMKKVLAMVCTCVFTPKEQGTVQLSRSNHFTTGRSGLQLPQKKISFPVLL